MLVIRITFLFILVLTPCHTLAKKLVFTQNAQGEKFTCAHKNLIQAYGELGIDLEFWTLPSKRSLNTSNKGYADAEMLRVAGIESDYPNLIQIPVPICAVELVILARENVQVHSIKDIKNYHLGITLGYVHQEKFAKLHNLVVTSVIRNDLLVDLLFRGRVDAIFLTNHEALEIIKSNPKFKLIPNYIEHVYLYHYLHKKHDQLVSAITERLTNMDKNGELDLLDMDLKRKPKLN